MTPAPSKTEIPCWNCPATMQHYGSAGYYDFFRCKRCGVEKAEQRETRDRDDHPKKPDSPPAFPGIISGDGRGDQARGQKER